MPLVKVHNKNLQGTVYYTYETEKIISDQLGIAKAFVGKRITNGNTSNIIIQVYNIPQNIPDFWFNKNFQAISAIAVMEGNMQGELIEVFSDYIQNEHNNRCIYIVREYHQEITLADLIRGKQDRCEFSNEQIRLYNQLLSEDRYFAASGIICNILSEVQKLHDYGVCNVDINPKSILINAKGEISLLDFGILKYWANLDNFNSYCRITHNPFNIEYAAPEVVFDDKKQYNPQTDVYAIGILYFELITGNVPFSGEVINVLRSQIQDSLPLKQIINSRIKKIIKKATEKEQGKRYVTCAQFKSAIEHVVFTASSRLPWWKKIFN